MLTTYLSQTKRLLQNPSSAVTALYTDADLTIYVNTARGQVAGDGECIRVLGTISTAVGTRNYNFSGINVGVPASTGIQGVIHVRSIRYGVGASGSVLLTSRAWEWFEYYCLNNAIPQNGVIAEWAQYAQGAAPPPSGAAIGGSFYLDPPPNAIYALTCDCVCYPAALVADADPEALPFYWTDAVPYYAAYAALMSAQTNARINDANRMLELYNTFIERARQFSNPSLHRSQYQQSGDPVQAGKLGLTQQKGQ